mgnify:FL=1
MATLSLADIRAIASIRNPDLELSEESIPTELIQMCINTLTSDATTPEEQALGYFTRRKLKRLANWNDWEAGEHKQIDQFMAQKMFGPPTNPASLPKDAVILRPH